MEIIKVDIDLLKEYEFNAKEHPREQIEQIKKSITDYGNNDPIAIDENNEIIEGHGRVIALKELGYSEVEAIRLSHLTDEQKRAYRLVHNKLTMNSDFDFELLEKELEALANFDIDMEDFGFDIDLATAIETPEDYEDDFDIDEAAEEIKEPICKLGDMWKLGKHRLICGDSTDIATIKRLMDGEEADLLLTDPPYNVAYEGGTKEKLTIKNDDMSQDEFLQFLTQVFINAQEVMKKGASFYVWHASREQINFEKALNNAELEIRQQLIWNKNSMVLGRQDYQWKHEPCFYGWKNGATHNWYSDRSQTTVLDFNKPVRNGEHPTMKPVELIVYQTKNSTKENDLVLDLFGGSGTTLIASEQTGRRCRMVELDPKYCDVIIKRWENLTGETAERIVNDESNSKAFTRDRLCG